MLGEEQDTADPAQSPVKPMRSCERSQNGLFREAPQRQSAASSPASLTRPSALCTTIEPVSFSGPARRARILSTGPGLSIDFTPPSKPSPLSEKPRIRWEPSQNGLFEAPP